MIAGRAGGIPIQFPRGYEHYLTASVDECAARVTACFATSCACSAPCSAGTRRETSSHMVGELDDETIDRILGEEAIGRIGCAARGRTYVVPVTYAFDGTTIYGHTGAGLKVQLMRENPSVCFEVEQLGNLPDWRCVIVFGRYEELHDEAAAAALDLLGARLREPPHHVLPPHGLGRWVPGPDPAPPRQSIVYAIRIREKSGRYGRER